MASAYEDAALELDDVKHPEAPFEAHAAANGTSSTISDSSNKADLDVDPPASDSVQKTEPGTAVQTDDRPPQATPKLDETRSTAKIAVIMSALCMAVFLAALDVTIITTALPTISEHFHSTAGYTWIGSAYLLANAATTPVWGKVSDIFGRKPVLLVANVVFMVGSLIAALSTSIAMLIVARAIQGVGGGGLVVLVNICIGDLFSMKSRPAYYGIIGGVWALASAVGPVIGGAFTEKVSWRWCFYINLPLDGLAFFIILFVLNLHTPKTPLWDGLKAIDWLGALSIIGGTLMFLLGLEFGGVTYPWASATVICLIVFGVITFAIFFLIEWKIAIYPVIPLRIFKHPSNLAALGVCFCQSFVFIAGSYYLPLYFQAVRGHSPLSSGVHLLAFALALSFASAATGVFIRKTGAYLYAIWFGMAIMTLGFGLFIDLTPSSSLAKIILYQIVAGIGVGPNFQAPLIALQNMVNPRDIASATATFGFTRNLATSISVVIGGVIFQNEMKKHAGMLVKALGPALATELGGGNAGANVQIIQSLPTAQRDVARLAFSQSLSKMWILYCVFGGFGLLVSFFIAKKKLSAVHHETKTGLDAERERNRAIVEEKRMKDAEAGEPAAASGVPGGDDSGRFGGAKAQEV